MKKYLVDVYLPTLGQHFDAYLPATKRIGEVTSLLVRIMSSLSNGNYLGTADSVLLDADSGLVYDRNVTVHDTGIRNASRLILI